MFKNNSKHYPNIIKLKTIEYEINMLLKAYETGQATYQQNILSKNYAEAAKNLAELTSINNMIQSNITNGQQVMSTLIDEGSTNQKNVSLRNPKLRKLAHRVQQQQNAINKMQQELHNVDGELQTTEISQNSNYLQYIVLVIVGIIVLGLTAKTLLTKNETLLDNSILVIIVGIILYFLIKKIMNY